MIKNVRILFEFDINDKWEVENINLQAPIELGSKEKTLKLVKSIISLMESRQPDRLEIVEKPSITPEILQ